MHSRKKRVTPPTEEELAAEKQRLEKVQKLHKMVFEEINSGLYTDSGFALSEKAMMVSPDIYTFLNFRRKLLLFKLTDSDQAERVKILSSELDLLTRIIKESPKSYTLWLHRQWVLEQGQNISEIMTKELNLCDYMLKKDNRNFHVWNYRSWVVDLEGNQSLNDEMEFTKSMICRDFSNFSAWHYRTKVVRKLYASKVPETFILSELQMLKNAYFTCPNDQSVWNYHRWLLLGLESIKIVGISPNVYQDPPQSLLVGFSHNIEGLSIENIAVSDGYDPVEGTWEPIFTKPFSYIWKFTPNTAFKSSVEIRLSPINTSAKDCNGNCKFTELIYKFTQNSEGKFEFAADGEEDVEIWKNELNSINELLDIEEDDVVQVLLRKAQIVENLAYALPKQGFLDQVIECYNILKSKDKKHAVFYNELFEAYNCLKFEKSPSTKITSLKIKAKLLGLEDN